MLTEIPNGSFETDSNCEQYTVERALTRHKYRVADANGDLIFRGERGSSSGVEEFLFDDNSGNQLFEVSANNPIDFAGNYTMTRPVSGETVAVFSRTANPLTNKWTIDAPDSNETQAITKTENKLETFFKSETKIWTLLRLAESFPQDYDITTPDGSHIGSISGEITPSYRYDVLIENPHELPTEIILVSVVIIDAIEGCR